MINGHGNNLYCYEQEVVADFSSNVFNHPKTTEVIEYLKQQLDCVKNYPDSNCTLLRDKIAENHSISREHILICNGSTEAFYLLAHAYKNSKSVIPAPSFSEYEDACTLYEHELEFPSNSVSLDTIKLEDKIVWLGNPNNPDGKYIEKPVLKKLIDANPNTLFVIDEAYIELCTGAESLFYEAHKTPNLILIKSFTKLFAIPGIRLGYIVAAPSIISKLRQFHMPWAVNAIALKAGEYIIDKLNGNSAQTDNVLSEVKILQNELSKIEGLHIIPSSCNYFLVKLELGDVQDLQHYLMKEYSFLIRNASNFRTLDSSWFRVASQGKSKNNELVMALKKWAKQK